VLHKFTAVEMKILKTVMKHGVRGIKILVSDGFMKAQNYINSIRIELDSNG
jgi:ribosomal protein S3